MNVCGACGGDFSSVRAFDSHRVGRHGYLFGEGLRRVPSVEDGRRCLDADELCAAGFAQNAKSVWFLVGRREDALARFSVDPDMAQAA